MRIAAVQMEDRPLLELRVPMFAESTQTDVEPSALLLPLGLVPAFERRGNEVVVESVIALVAHSEQKETSTQAGARWFCDYP
ncbi:hypothetical protein GCM10029992_36810 [Glycomyces albus]